MALTKVIGNGIGTLGDGTANDTKIVFDGNAQDYHIGLDDSSDKLVIGKGTALGTTTSMTFDANGIINKPLQPASNAYVSSHFTIPINTNHDVVFGSENYDVNSDYDTSNGQFTAPVDGKYLVSTSLYVFNYLDTDASYYYLTLFTSNETVDVLFFTSSFLDSDSSGFNMQCSAVLGMDAGDTAKTIIYQSGGAAQTQIAGAHSNFNVTLLC
jgi:hypothetical protein